MLLLLNCSRSRHLSNCVRNWKINCGIRTGVGRCNLDERTMAEEPEYTLIKEGQAEIYQPVSVFYNNVQEFNRDLSVLAMNTYLEQEMWTKAKFGKLATERGLKVLDALSATGLRSIRYAKELETKHKLNVVANDISTKAVEIIRKNIEHNNVAEKVSVANEDASLLLYQSRKFDDRYTILDLDPYGSAAPFIDGAVQSVSDGGLLMITCTDLAILCGNHSETCYAKYGGMSLRLPSCHEMALRIVLKSVESSANKYGRYIVPLLSMSADFYIRLFMQVFTSPLHAKRSPSKTGYVYQCEGCLSHTIQPVGKFVQKSDGDNPKCDYTIAKGPSVDRLCEHCSGQHLVGGPIWIGELHSTEFLEKVLANLYVNSTKYKTFRRLEGMIQVMTEELNDVPLYNCMDKMSRTVHCSSPPMAVLRSALLNAGYRVSYSHAHKTSIKTNAPNAFLWDIMRKWIESNPIDRTKWGANDRGLTILDKGRAKDVNLDIHEDAEPYSKKQDMVRYQHNPEPNWGPKPRASAKNLGNNSPESKKLKLSEEDIVVVNS